MAEVTLSTKNKIVLPREARQALGVKAGDKLLFVVRRDQVIVFPKPKSYHKAILGIAKDVYPDGYLDDERNSWD